MCSCGGQGQLPVLHSFPTRRSSDLELSGNLRERDAAVDEQRVTRRALDRDRGRGDQIDGLERCGRDRGGRADREHAFRSEEHTSELQSQSNLVWRLLLETKKKKTSV